MVWMVHIEMHRSPKYWEGAHEFLPERWTVEPGHKLYPMKGAVSELYLQSGSFAKLPRKEIVLIIALHSGDLSNMGRATALPKA